MTAGKGLLDLREYSAVQYLRFHSSMALFTPRTPNHVAKKEHPCVRDPHLAGKPPLPEALKTGKRGF